MMKKNQTPKQNNHSTNQPANMEKEQDKIVEIGGPKGPEPTRFGDWEKKGRCIDF